MADWRLRSQEAYLKGVEIHLSNYDLVKPDGDHDHCEFCWDKFSHLKKDLQAGYCTTDFYRWICEPCYNDFKEMFGWKVVAN